MIGLRFVAPYATDAKVIQHTIQLIPRLPEPTLVTAVLVEPNVPVKKGQPLFQFDRRQYEYKVQQLEAELAEAKQDVLELKASLDIAEAEVKQAKASLGRAETDLRSSRVRAKRLHRFKSQIDGKVFSKLRQSSRKPKPRPSERGSSTSRISAASTRTVASLEAELAQARFYLDNTTMVAPEDGYIFNLQVRPGMVCRHCPFRRDRLVRRRRGSLRACHVLPGEPEVREAGAAGGTGDRPVSRADLPRHGAGDLAGERRGAVAAERHDARLEAGRDRRSRRDSSRSRSISTMRISPSSRSAPRAGQPSTPIPRAGSSFCARSVFVRYSWFNWLYPFSG